ncbi:MAG: hypothetical protein HY976_02920 [Candidatus Kerfeldbacteria bacterium]|nr:hypothetical protein [Candidatus Kerfeldbacteria bacterium]
MPRVLVEYNGSMLLPKDLVPLSDHLARVVSRHMSVPADWALTPDDVSFKFDDLNTDDGDLDGIGPFDRMSHDIQITIEGAFHDEREAQAMSIGNAIQADLVPYIPSDCTFDVWL